MGGWGWTGDMNNYINTDERDDASFIIQIKNYHKSAALVCGLLLWNLGLESLDLGACVGQQLKHFLLLHDNKDIKPNWVHFTPQINNTWGKCPNIFSRRRTRESFFLLTCTATPKLLPSSILGTWSCTHIDTCQENLKLFISHGIYELVTVFTTIPVIKIPIQLHLKQVSTLKKEKITCHNDVTAAETWHVISCLCYLKALNRVLKGTLLTYVVH